MAVQRSRSLFESATQRARVVRHLDIVCLIFDGSGALIVPTADFVQNQKWASARMASGNAISDRGRFVERLTTLVSRPGSMASTRGSPRQLEAIARSMRAAGYDLNEWMLPAEIRNPPVVSDMLNARKPAAPQPADQLLPDPSAQTPDKTSPEPDAAGSGDEHRDD